MLIEVLNIASTYRIQQREVGVSSTNTFDGHSVPLKKWSMYNASKVSGGLEVVAQILVSQTS